MSMTPLRLIVMGVSGCGKSTIAGALSEHLRLDMVDGDDLHLPQSVAKMRAGIALQDIVVCRSNSILDLADRGNTQVFECGRTLVPQSHAAEMPTGQVQRNSYGGQRRIEGVIATTVYHRALRLGIHSTDHIHGVASVDGLLAVQVLQRSHIQDPPVGPE